MDVASSIAGVVLRDTKITKSQIGKSPVGVLVGSMSFADSSGSDWQYSGVGELHHLDNLPEVTITTDGYLAPDWSNASGCSRFGSGLIQIPGRLRNPDSPGSK
jgi:hypothetical protein